LGGLSSTDPFQSCTLAVPDACARERQETLAGDGDGG
jgi:hypothetical protein